MLIACLVVLCLIWYFAVLSVSCLGYIQIWQNFRQDDNTESKVDNSHRSEYLRQLFQNSCRYKPQIIRLKSVPSSMVHVKQTDHPAKVYHPNDIQLTVCRRCSNVTSLNKKYLAHITIIRPIKGLETELYACLASTYHLNYPDSLISIRFCLASRDDPALFIVKQVVDDHPHFDSQVLIGEDDPRCLQANSTVRLGPNPKIRNMSRAFLEAPSDIIWILDCNVWVNPDVACLMVTKLCGLDGDQKYKLVHQLPLVIDVSQPSGYPRFSTGGGLLEEAFMASSHAKFYTAINTVAIAPCIVGKSNMFRRSHLNALTQNRGIDFFSVNICEDHLIGDLLWKHDLPDNFGHLDPIIHHPSDQVSKTISPHKLCGQHYLIKSHVAIQPVQDMSISAYCARRVRWLRVRKFIVAIATLAEPGTESILCSMLTAWAVSKLHEYAVLTNPESCFIRLTTRLNYIIPNFWTFFTLNMAFWMIMDRWLYVHLSNQYFPHPQSRNFWLWLSAWLCREILALPIWIWAVILGSSVHWKDGHFNQSAFASKISTSLPSVPTVTPLAQSLPENDSTSLASSTSTMGRSNDLLPDDENNSLHKTLRSRNT